MNAYELEFLKDAYKKISQQADRIAELEKTLIKIEDGCQNIKLQKDLHDDAKKMASLIIRDCNIGLKTILEAK